MSAPRKMTKMFCVVITSSANIEGDDDFDVPLVCYDAFIRASSVNERNLFTTKKRAKRSKADLERLFPHNRYTIGTIYFD